MSRHRPLVIAHRGASGYVPEHTLMAKGMAHAMGADYLEQDVVLSKDRIPVVLHDVHIDTVTDVAKLFPDRHRQDGRFYAIDFTLAELQTLNATERFDHRTGKQVFPNRFPTKQGTFRIPTLEEELKFIQSLNRVTGREAGVYPEIKAPAWHRAQGYDPSPIVIALLKKFGYEEKSDRCFLQCFEYPEVKRIRTELGYNGQLIQLLSAGTDRESGTDFDQLRTPEGLREVAQVADGIGPPVELVVKWADAETPIISSLVRDAHQAKLAVHPYTLRVDALPKHVKSLEQLLDVLLNQIHVDGFFIDHPDRGVSFVRSHFQGE